MLSRKAQYALKALLLLAERHGHGPVAISELAERDDMPVKFLELVLLQLKHRGILASRKGKGGGYLLGRGPEAITFGEVIRILDGPLAPVPCASKTAYMRCEHCPDEARCGVRIVMQEVRDATAGILDTTSLADVVARIKGRPRASRRGERKP
jgi:Rrf2 family protein